MKAFLKIVVAVVAAIGSSAVTAQQDFPSKPVRLVIPYPPGGPTDLLGRLAGQKLQEVWKQSVVVENRAGASGSIGSDFVAKAAPDGYTLVLGNNASHGAYELLNPKVAPYRTLKDFSPVSLIGIAPLYMMARANLGFKTLKDYVDYAKANPGKLNFASAAIGSAPHFGGELLNIVAGIRTTHVPFNGAAPAIQAMLSNNVDSYMGGVSSVKPHVDSGKAVLLAVIGAERTSQYPNLPTAGEQGFKGVEYDSWYGLLAPAGVAAGLLDKINADFNRGFAGDDVKVQLQRLGFERKLGSRTEFVKLLVEEEARSQRIIREANIKVD